MKELGSVWIMTGLDFDICEKKGTSQLEEITE
jgi:hypothetical protein